MIYALLLCLSLFAEEAPPAEHPYPERSVATDELEIEQPKRKGSRGEYYYDTKKKSKDRNPYQGVEQPARIGADGTYYYDSSPPKEEDKVDSYEGVEQPVDQDSGGGYYYSRKRKPKEPQKLYGEKPTKIEKDGTYLYDVEINETQNTFSFRGGVLGAPQISSGQATYESVYGNGDSFLLTFEYDWIMAHNLYLKLGSGFTSAQGVGRFGRGATTPARETFQFFVFPNTLSISYKFQFYPVQYVTPYVDAGAGYFTFIESRSDGDIFSFDGETTKLGGAFVATATAGLLISLSKWSTGTNLLTDYGATQSWIDLQYRQVFGLDSRKDFSSNMITGGFAIGF